MDWLSTMMHRREILYRWLQVILWAGLIFYFSTESFAFDKTSGFLTEWLPWLLPGIDPAELTPFHMIMRKTGHWFEYFVLAILLLRAMRREAQARLETAALARAIVLVFAYAVSDELHQTWVPDRTASGFDVMIDTFGGVCGVIWMHLRHNWKGKKPTPSSQNLTTER